MKQPQLANAFKMHFQNPMFFLLPDEDEFKNMKGIKSKIKIKRNGRNEWWWPASKTGKYPNIQFKCYPDFDDEIFTGSLIIKCKNILDIETPGYEFTQRNGAEMLKEVKKTPLFFFYLKPLKKALADMRLRHPVTMAGKIVIGLRLFGWRIL